MALTKGSEGWRQEMNEVKMDYAGIMKRLIPLTFGFTSATDSWWIVL